MSTSITDLLIYNTYLSKCYYAIILLMKVAERSMELYILCHMPCIQQAPPTKIFLKHDDDDPVVVIVAEKQQQEKKRKKKCAETSLSQTNSKNFIK